ncbi:MAG: alpha/beta hydrolase [Burkholderiales bacterium]
MPYSAPFFREAGNGPNVVCLHSSAASSAQWLPLMDQLCDKYRVLAVDLYGEGKSPPWTSGRDCTIDDELELLNPLLDERAPFTLVGHSYGGAVGVRIALAKRQSVQALVLYEPALWGLLATVDPDGAGTKEIEAVRQSLIEQLGLGNDEAATQGFIDYWVGAGTWASLPEHRRPSLIQGAKANAKKWRESLGYPFSEEEIQELRLPVLLLAGSSSTLAAVSVVTRLQALLPQAEVVALPGLGHLGPLTHPAVVNAEISSFLARLPEHHGGVV